MLLGITMFLNVWGVIWRNQKVVIANARNVLAGGEADPNAAAAGRKALLASRQNAIFSFTMLFFMIGAAHFFTPGTFDTTDKRGIYWAITGILWLVLELNCLGVIGGAAQNATNWIYEDHKRAIGAGLVLVVVWYALWEIIF
jgi:cytochrome c biogenesis protein CcdA